MVLCWNPMGGLFLWFNALIFWFKQTFWLLFWVIHHSSILKFGIWLFKKKKLEFGNVIFQFKKFQKFAQPLNLMFIFVDVLSRIMS